MSGPEPMQINEHPPGPAPGPEPMEINEPPSVTNFPRNPNGSPPLPRLGREGTSQQSRRISGGAYKHRRRHSRRMRKQRRTRTQRRRRD